MKPDNVTANHDLTLDDIPGVDASWNEINLFAHRFDGYAASDSIERCAAIASERRHDTLTELRTCLFFEARSWRHGGEDPDEQAMPYISDVIRQIRTKVTAGDLV